MGSASDVTKPHAVCIPYPAQGHINPMLKLAKLLYQKGFHITFVNTEYNHRRLLKSRGPDSLNGLPDFQFKTIPDGLPPTDTDTTQDIPSLCESTRKNCAVPLSNLVTELNNTSISNAPPVSCIVSDGTMSFTLKVSQDLSIPLVFFWTLSAFGWTGYLHYSHLVKRGIIPLKEQQTNCRYLCSKWGIGMEIDNNVKRDEIESLVRELMQGDKGMEMKLKAIEWKKSAEEATARGRSSHLNPDKLIDQMLLSSTANISV